MTDLPGVQQVLFFSRSHLKRHLLLKFRATNFQTGLATSSGNAPHSSFPDLEKNTEVPGSLCGPEIIMITME